MEAETITLDLDLKGGRVIKRIRNRLDALRRQPCWMPLRVAARLTIACLLLSFLGGSKLATIGWANGPPTVSIAPASQEVFLEDTAAAEVWVEDVTDLYGFEFQLTFNPTLVEVVDADPVKAGVQIQPGDFLSPDWELDNTVDNDNGTIDYALSQWDPSPPQSGDGVLAIITWRGKVLGTSPIAFSHVLLGAPGGVPIDASTQDGQIKVCLFGDFDCNCIIDVSDMMEVASHWRTSEGGPGYDPRCDLDDDGDTDIVDIMLVAAYWGDTC